MRGVSSSSFAVPPKGRKTWREIGANVFLPEKSLEGEEETLLSPTFFFFPAFFFGIRMNVFPLPSSPSYLSRKEEEKKEGRAIAVDFFFLLLLLPLPPNTTLSLLGSQESKMN